VVFGVSAKINTITRTGSVCITSFSAGPTLHYEFDGIERIWQIHWEMLHYFGLDERIDHIQLFAFWFVMVCHHQAFKFFFYAAR